MGVTASTKTCFVISPIGDEGSAIRQEADALLWIIRRALEKYDFRVIRVDEIARSTVITNDIVQLIQESTLAMIVLTGHNPNVFYEAGRRHETGKPFVQLIRRGETLPFDVAGIKTILYENIDTLVGAAKTVDNIQKFIEEFEKAGYGSTGAGVSLSTIAVAIDRIERKISQIAGGPQTLPGAGPIGDLGGLTFLEDPRAAFMGAVATGNLSKAASLLPRLEGVLGPTPEMVGAAAFLASAGDERAADTILRILDDNAEKYLAGPVGQDQDDAYTRGLQAGLSALVRCHVVRDREVEGLARLMPWFDKALAVQGITDNSKAFLLNQLSMLFYGSKDYARAVDIVEQAIDLNPTQAAYLYNGSLIYEKLGLAHKCLALVDRYMSAESDAGDDADHLSHAVEIYAKNNNADKARRAFDRLRQISQEKAALLLLDRDLKRTLGL